MHTRVLIASVLFVTGCTSSDQIVVENNDLGIVALEAHQTSEGGNSVLELRGFTADQQERVLVRRTIGVIPGLSKITLGPDDVGTEIVAVVGGKTKLHMATREMHRFPVDASKTDDPDVTRFLQLSEVSSTLQRMGNIEVINLARESSELPFSTESCPSDTLIAPPGPVAYQCCYQTGTNNPGNWTVFIRPSDNTMVVRGRHPTGAHCSSGSWYQCFGADCYYGPNGFSRPFFYSGYAGVFSGGGYCVGSSSAQSEFPNVTGSFPAGSCNNEIASTWY